MARVIQGSIVYIALNLLCHGVTPELVYALICHMIYAFLPEGCYHVLCWLQIDESTFLVQDLNEAFGLF